MLLAGWRCTNETFLLTTLLRKTQYTRHVLWHIATVCVFICIPAGSKIIKWFPDTSQLVFRSCQRWSKCLKKCSFDFVPLLMTTEKRLSQIYAARLFFVMQPCQPVFRSSFDMWRECCMTTPFFSAAAFFMSLSLARSLYYTFIGYWFSSRRSAEKACLIVFRFEWNCRRQRSFFFLCAASALPGG